MSDTESPAMEFAKNVGTAIEDAAENGVDAETVVIALSYHIGNTLRYCDDPTIMVRVLEAIQEMNNEHEESVKIHVEGVSSDEELQDKLTAMKEKPEGDLH